MVAIHSETIALASCLWDSVVYGLALLSVTEELNYWLLLRAKLLSALVPSFSPKLSMEQRLMGYAFCIFVGFVMNLGNDFSFLWAHL